MIVCLNVAKYFLNFLESRQPGRKPLAERVLTILRFTRINIRRSKMTFTNSNTEAARFHLKANSPFSFRMRKGPPEAFHKRIRCSVALPRVCVVSASAIAGPDLGVSLSL